VTDQAAYQVRTVADNAGAPDTGTVYTDTGTVTDVYARTVNVAFATNGRYEHVQMRVYYDALWSDWSSVRIAVAYTIPATPTVVVTPDDELGYIAVAATHPAPVGDQPVVACMDIYRSEAGAPAIRIAKSLVPTNIYRDYAVASLVGYNYIVAAVGTTGTTAYSAQTD
jgi:hypothetical protein